MTPIFVHRRLMSFVQDGPDRTGYEHVVEARNEAARALLPQDAKVLLSHYTQRKSEEEKLCIARLLAESVPAIAGGEIDAILTCEETDDLSELAVCAMASKDSLARDDYEVAFLLPSYRGNLVATFDELGRVKVNAVEFRVDFESHAHIAWLFDCWHMDREEISLTPAPAKLTDNLETLQRAFWTKVNPKFEDQWLDGEEDAFFTEQEEPDFISGSPEELAEITRILVAAWFGKDGKVDGKAQINFPAGVPTPLPCDMGERYGRLVRSDCTGLDNAPEALWEALEKAHAENQFDGWIIDYNDGRHNRHSGYSHDRTFFAVDVDPDLMSAHERLELYSDAAKARTWLTDAGFNTDQITEICG